ncbi:MAG: anaerobic C4-dicarboxylate transporter [Prevotellaceae bacterium]|nr:anaerobic C4-dicarboxylate transporter [Prevotellaceae bacterium]
MLITVIELLVLLLALYLGSRYGSLALGAIAGLGLAILVFDHGLKPGTPPTDVIYIIVAAVTCAGVLQASGGMDWLVQIAEKLLRKHPQQITFLAPLCTFFLTVLCGTGHVMYTLMPIVTDVAIKKGIRPERPCAIASVASMIAIICSPISAAVVAFSTISALNGFHISIPQIVAVTLPSCLIGVMIAAAWSYRRGLDLDKDPEFQEMIKNPEQREYVYGNTATTLDKKIDAKSKRAVYIFLTAIIIIVILAFAQHILPAYQTVQAIEGAKDVLLPTGKTVTPENLASAGIVMAGVTEKVPVTIKMYLVIQIILISAAALMIIFCGAKPKNAVAGNVWQSGMVAVVAIYGIAWLANTFFGAHMDQIKDILGTMVAEYKWTVALMFFVFSVLINSQGAVIVSLLPVAYALGVPGWVLLGALPCVYGYFFIPNYPTDIATVNMDRTGTTKIGKFVFNHSFMVPGLISVVVSTLVCYALASIFF